MQNEDRRGPRRRRAQSGHFEDMEQRAQYEHRKEQKRIRTQRRKRMERKRRRNSILLVIGLISILMATYGLAKVYVRWKAWEDKAETPEFKSIAVTATQPHKVDQEENIINIAIFGTDEDGLRTDLNMLASFNTETGKLAFISIPRDTRVTMTADMISFLKENNKMVPVSTDWGVYGQCKFTEIYAYAPSGNRNAFSVAMMEDVLGVSVDYYVTVDLSAFREIVDAIGGVEMYVPRNMYWDMRDTGGILINLQEGYQTLHGAEAEQLVRYRKGYAQQDLTRIEVQHEFMRAFLNKIVSTDTLLSSAGNLISIALDKTESNIVLSEALQYVKYLSGFDVSQMESYTIPGTAEESRCFDLYEEEMKELIDRVIYGMEPDESEQNTEMQVNAEEIEENE